MTLAIAVIGLLLYGAGMFLGAIEQGPSNAR
jgi:hypothetical protein